MNSLNKAQIIGNVTRDPEVRETTSGKSVCTLGVATNRRWKDAEGELKESAEFHHVVCWGKLAELAKRFVQRGSKVFFEGRLQTREWEDEAGIKHHRTEIIAQDMLVLDRKKESTESPEDITILSENIDI